MQDTKNELRELLEALLIEKEEDFDRFKAHVQSLTLDEKRKQGYTWNPLEVVSSGYTYGERAFVEVQRGKALNQPHAFRSGKTVSFYTSQAGVRNPDRIGIINYVDRNKMKIVLNAKDLPDWIGLGMLGVDLLFDERTYLEMEKALKQVMEAKGDRLAELRNIFLGKAENKFFHLDNPRQISSLNQFQNEAVNQILSSLDVAIIHGPPGTGKTTTIVQAIKLIAETEMNILVTAPSNTAVDLLTERIANEGLRVVRIGNISRVDENLIMHTVDAQLAAHPESKNIKKVKIQAAELRRSARKFKRKFGFEERNNRKELLKEAKELSSWANHLEERLIDQILSSANVITATLVGASSNILKKIKFKTVIIDEAAQALEPASWIPIIRSSRVILAGDPLQLPPTIKSFKAKSQGLGKTLIEKGIERLPNISLLKLQYRMNETIMGFSNQQFYNNVLLADTSVAKRQIGDTSPLVFIDTAGCSFDEVISPNTQSKHNPDEFNILREHLYQLAAYFKNEEYPEIAIISPYREQVIYIKQNIAEDELLSPLPIRVGTIDGFQGQESDIVYISLVRSNGEGEIGFLKDYRRMNVAMTRAKRKLVIIGDSATIGGDNFYAAFLDYCDKHGLYQSAWEYMRSEE
ncbi:MAG: ATP-dependent RNA/DNA helicase IGHMBP2 [Saprospiraceae bacterium]|jgi:ATP-dependent RNA/DNA helicase IGHMBP2